MSITRTINPAYKCSFTLKGRIKYGYIGEDDTVLAAAVIELFRRWIEIQWVLPIHIRIQYAACNYSSKVRIKRGCIGDDNTLTVAVVAERLRRCPRNIMRITRIGSNPVFNVLF